MTGTIVQKKKTRQSNLELLRVFSMILILLYHMARWAEPVNKIDEILVTALSSWGILGVNAFVAISSYFLLDQKFKLSRVLTVLMQLITYSIVFLGIRLAYDYVSTGTPVLKNLLIHGFEGLAAPFWVTRYWFVWTYILLCILSPFLNLLIQRLNRSNHLKLLACMSFILIYGTFGNGEGVVCDLSFFIYIYISVAYIKKYPDSFLERKAAIGSAIMAVLLVFAKALLSFFGAAGDMVSSSVFSTNRHSAYMVLMALLVFCVFKNMKMKQSPFVNFLAPLALGIYLFHENMAFNLTDLLCQKMSSVLHIPSFALLLICAAILFTVGGAVELVRRTLDKPFIRFVNNSQIAKRIDKQMELNEKEE